MDLTHSCFCQATFVRVAPVLVCCVCTLCVCTHIEHIDTLRNECSTHVHMDACTHVHKVYKVLCQFWSDSDSLVPCIERMGCTWHYLGIPGQKKHLDTMSTEHLEPMINFQNNCYPKEQLNAF